MADWQVDERFLDFVVKKSEFDSGLRSVVGATKPFVGVGQKEYSMNDLVDEMRQGTRIGKRLYTTLYGIHEKEFKDYLTQKPNLDELIEAIDDVYSIDQQRKEADWPLLRHNKDFLLEKCSTIRRVLFAYLEEAPTLRGYLITVDDLENGFKQL